MKVNWGVEVAGSGIGVPEKVMTNEDWAQRLDTSDEWIVQRTGIRQRRWAAEHESTLTFAERASRGALAQAGVTPQDIDLIVCGTITPDHPLPSTSCELQAALGCGWVPAFDVVAACSGFVYAMITAAQYVVTGMSRCALVVGADCLTRVCDMEDRQSAILFGDGAGAVVLRPSRSPNAGILATRMGADGGRAMLIWVPAGGSREPASMRTVNERLHVMRMKGRDVYKFAVSQMQAVILDTARDAGIDLKDISLLVPHQSNLRIIESACQKLDIPPERVFINIHRMGNTSAASVPIAFHEARAERRLRRGDLALLVAFGAGLTWSSILLRL